MKIKNIALAISIAATVIGFSDLQENAIFWMGRPVGAIFFIVYFIFAVLEKESAEFDRQEHEKNSTLKPNPERASKKQNAPSLVRATSH